MIHVRALLLNRILHSLWSVGAMALLMASLLEWGLVAEHHALQQQLTKPNYQHTGSREARPTALAARLEAPVQEWH